MIILADILSATVLFAVPLLLVALGGMFSERSGVVNIALEGIMIVGALVSTLSLRWMDAMGWGRSAPQGAMLLAILIAGLSGLAYSGLLAFASIHLKADQTIGGTALNMLAPAFAVVLTWSIQGQGNTTIFIPTWTRLTAQAAGLAGTDGFFPRLVFKSFYLTTPLALLLLALAAFVLYRTRLGLRLRACGEHPQAADSVGVNVYRMRYTGVLISGFLAGIGGLAFTVAAGSGYQATVAGYGFLALAVMIFGNWKPLNIFLASLLFAFFKIIGSYSSSIPFLPDFRGIRASEYIYLMLPYAVTMVVLILSSRKSRAPKAAGTPYDKGKR
ncbi:MAG TPA: ABC transporter permease [Candidatus Limnocylindria bacterium]|nr:ABC transporter permease [Candidatus Limnocylindria bacterium]